MASPDMGSTVPYAFKKTFDIDPQKIKPNERKATAKNSTNSLAKLIINLLSIKKLTNRNIGIKAKRREVINSGKALSKHTCESNTSLQTAKLLTG